MKHTGDTKQFTSINFSTENRGYSMEMEKDLFDFYILHRNWYGLKTNKHGSKKQVFDTNESLAKEVNKIIRRRILHGYNIINVK